MSAQGSKSTDPKMGGGAWIYSVAPLLVALVLLLWYGKGYVVEHKKAVVAEEKATAAHVAAHPPAPVVAPEYPTHGEGHATKEVGLKAWLDPKKTHVHPSRPARYTFVQDPTLSWDDCAGARVESNSSKHVRVWLEEMPAGEYTVKPINEGDRIFFRWWQ
jgi:hypothetical protein